MKIQSYPLDEQQQTKLFRLLEIIYLLFLLCFYTLWAYTLPFDGAPDELMRYQIPMFIYENNALPHGGDPSIRNEIWGISYGFNPIFSYMISALFMKVTSIFTTTDFALLLSARMVSVLCGVGTGYFAIQISKKLFPCVYRAPFVVIVTMLPQMVYITSYVNNDSMALCSTAMIVYMWILGIETNWNPKSCIGLAFSISLCALSYYNAYGFILCSILLFGFTSAFCQEGKKFDYSNMFKKGLLISGIVLVCISWWFIRNAILYDGDFLAREISREYAELYAASGFKPSDHPTPQNTGRSLKQMLIDDQWLYFTRISFVGYFGYMEYPLPLNWYPYYMYLFYIGAAGMLIKLSTKFRLRRNKKWNPEGLLHFTFALAMVIPIFLSIYYSYTSDFQAQGRYILPMIIPFSYFVIQGISTFIDYIIRNKHIKYLVTCIFSCFWIYMTIQSFTQVLYPAYYY